MKFWEAMKALEEGKKVRKKDWDEWKYLHLNDSNCIVNEVDMYVCINLIHINDDWEIYNKDFGEFVKGIEEMDLEDLTELLKSYNIKFEDEK